jgi:hypothetical protein
MNLDQLEVAISGLFTAFLTTKIQLLFKTAETQKMCKNFQLQ